MSAAAIDQRPDLDRAQRAILRIEGAVGVLIVLLSVAYAADLQRKVGLSIYDAQLLVASLSLALIAGFLAMARTTRSVALRVVDLACAVTVLGVGGYLAVTYVDTSMEAPYLPGWVVGLSAVMFAALMLNLKTSAGIGILAVVLIFLAYGLLGHLMPGELQSRETTPAELIVYLVIDPNGIWAPR